MISEVACWIPSVCLVLLQITVHLCMMGNSGCIVCLSNSVAAELTQSPIAAEDFSKRFKAKSYLNDSFSNLLLG